MGNSLVRKPFRYRYYNATLIIIGINVFVFLVGLIAPNVKLYLAMNPVLVVQGKAFWQVITYMFAHANISHIFFNMLGLLFFGIQVERRLGSSEFILFYMISGIGAGLFSLLVYWFSGNYLAVLLGASGAVYGVLLALATLYPEAVVYVFGIIPVKAPILVLGYTVIELVSQFFDARSGVAHLTHLAGFGFAFLYFIVRLGINPIREFFGGRRRWP